MSAISSALSTPFPYEVSADLRQEPLPQGLELTIEHGKLDIKVIPKKYNMDFANTNLFNDIVDEGFKKICITARKMYRTGEDLAHIHACINDQIANLKREREAAASRYKQQRLEDTEKAASFGKRLTGTDFTPKLPETGAGKSITATHPRPSAERNTQAGRTGKAFESAKRTKAALGTIKKELSAR